MNGEQDWETRVRAAVVVGLAALIALGAALANQVTAAADAPPYAARATRDSQIPHDAADQGSLTIPAAGIYTGPELESCMFALSLARGSAAVPGIGHAAPSEGPGSDAPAADAEPYDVIHWEVHQKATGTTEYRGP